MANKNMQFISSTTKDGFYIKGTDNLYVFQLTTGTAENPRQAFLNYLYEKNRCPYLVYTPSLLLCPLRKCTDVTRKRYKDKR
jgi:hypothetical protein